VSIEEKRGGGAASLRESLPLEVQGGGKLASTNGSRFSWGEVGGEGIHLSA